MFPRNTSREVAAFVLCDFYQSISFIDELSVSKSSTDEYRMVQYRICAINMQNIEKLRWKNFLYVQDSFLLLYPPQTKFGGI